MARIGLALSGGGFRATLYHLGVVRLLRDADLLESVSVIASVSGGSILGAHLALNWDRYTGSDEEFAEAADEIVKFVQLDIRNKIVRRLPLQGPLRILERLTPAKTGMANANDLIEFFYRKHLYGDTCLYQLPEKPELHILATNVSEGGLVSFTQQGLFVQRRKTDSDDPYDHVPGRMATLAKAVGASSAFPGFFPPVEIAAEDLGVRDGTFSKEALTDGGVYDNLGIRAFSWLKDAHLRKNSTVKQADLHDIRAVCRILTKGGEHATPTIAWMRSQLTEPTRQSLDQQDCDTDSESLQCLLQEMSVMLKRGTFYHEPEFHNLALPEGPSSDLRRVRSGDEILEFGKHVWLNRHLMAAALEQEIGKPVLSTYERDFDEIIVSDAGKPFQILSDTSLGFVAQSVRASDILWDRVWQLERENFQSDRAFRFVPITDFVEPRRGTPSLHPVIQNEVQSIRTDLDRFSPLEVGSLVQHGYAIARKACEDDGLDLPDKASGYPWSPFLDLSNATEESKADATSVNSTTGDPVDVSRDARMLRRSAERRVWETLFDGRDWPSYVYLLLLLILVVYAPLQVYQLYKKSQVQATVIEAISGGDPTFRKILEIVDENALEGWNPIAMSTTPTAADVDYDGVEILGHTRIIDLRRWMPERSSELDRGVIYVCDKITVRKRKEYAGDGKLVLRYPFPNEAIEVQIPPGFPRPQIRKVEEPIVLSGESRVLFEVEYSLSQVLIGDRVDLEIEFLGKKLEADYQNSRFLTEIDTDVVSVWLLFPANRKYRGYELVSYPIDRSQPPQRVETQYTIDHPYGALIGWSVVKPGLNTIYDCRWER